MSVNRIRAGTTGACQTCNLPVHCTLDARITFGSLQDVYRHEPFFSRHYHCLVQMHKKPFAEIPLELSATPKRCLSKSDTGFEVQLCKKPR